MDYLSNNVAVNLKRIRKSKSMSLDQVSEQTGVRLREGLPILLWVCWGRLQVV
jgi:transcriptional regulator with XRE-family HTH domain